MTAPHVATQPVTDDERSAEEESLRDGVALCLSGGGYRAMLFHAGALVRLNELGFLARLSRVSSVSGGSIVAAKLGLEWSKLGFDAEGTATDLDRRVIGPIRALASRTIDVKAVILGPLTPFRSASDYVASALARGDVLGKATLEDLPDDPTEGPRFVINATNVQTGKLLRFSRPYVADYSIGQWMSPKTRLSDAVAASAAFPPVFSPHRIKATGTLKSQTRGPNQGAAFEKSWVASDGGVYDNLGLETAWKMYRTILVSDGGGAFETQTAPKTDWARHSVRVAEIVDSQVRSLRKRQLIDSYIGPQQERLGTYWGIRSQIEDYELADSLTFMPQGPVDPANVKTRLAKIPEITQLDLLRWGYTVCDTAMRRWVTRDAAPGSPHF